MPLDEPLAAAGFRSCAKAWLASEAPDFETQETRLSHFSQKTPLAQADEVARARAWEAHKAAAGFGGIAVPRRYGGSGMTMVEATVFEELESEFSLPLDVFAITRRIVIPTLLAWGSESQKRRLISAAINGIDLWCQLFSEPGAGSDLAALATKAESTDSGWRIRGNKVWISFGHHADRGYLLARTDPHVPKHGGLSAFLVDMHDVGVRSTPLVQATGGMSFTEVVFDDLIVKKDAIVGHPGDGWKVAISTLMNERLAVGADIVPLAALVDLIRRNAAETDVSVRSRLGEIIALHGSVERIAKSARASTVRPRSGPGVSGSAAKLLAVRAAALAGALALDVLGEDALVYDAWAEYGLGMFGLQLGGGTEEILLTLIGERVLGLPPEPRLDRDVTWNEARRDS